MSLTMAKADGVTVLTLTSDPDSPCPPLCQILRGLCYSPVCCSVSEHLRRVQRISLSVLGTLHIMIGLFTIGLGCILIASDASLWMIDYFGFRAWVGVPFILFGIVSILSEKYPNHCLVFLNVTLNLAGVAFALAAIILYIMNMGNRWSYDMCWDDYRPYRQYHDEDKREKCFEGGPLITMLLRDIIAVLIALSVLEIAVAIISVILGIKALTRSQEGEKESSDDPEHKPLLEEVASDPIA